MHQSVPRIQRCLFITSNINKFTLHNLKCLHSTSNNSTDVDVLDEFSVQLSKNKSEKWKMIQQANRLKHCSGNITYRSPWQFNFKNRLMSVLAIPKTLDVDISNLPRESVDELIIGTLDSEGFHDMEHLTNQCIANQICPSMDVLINLLSIYSSNGNTKMVESLRELCRNEQNDKYMENYKLKHFVAKTIWIKGDIEKAVELFVELYLIDSPSRKIVRNIIKYLVSDTVSHRSEASVVILTKKMIMFGERFNDWSFLMFLWHCSWLSEWFGDQQLANSLFNDHEPLRNILVDRLPPLSTMALRDHQEDAIIRLLQLLLHNKMMFCYTRVLECLFIYKYKREDLYACHQIVRSCLPLKIKLQPDIQTKYITLLATSGYSFNQPTRVTRPAPPEPAKMKF